MIFETEKLLLSLNSILKMDPEHADRISMRQIMDLLDIRQKEGKCIKLIKKKTASIRIQEMEIDTDNEIVSMLIQYSDKEISDPVFQDLASGELRPEAKLEGEGIAVSAHIVFSLIPTEPRGNAYDTILEEAPGVSMSRITGFLNTEFKTVSDFSFTLEGETFKSRPRIEMAAKISKNFKEDLEAGVFKEIILEQYKVEDFMDEDSIMKTIKKAITLKIEDSEMAFKARANPSRLVKSIFNQAKLKGFDNVVVKYQTENKRSKTVNVDTKLEEAMNVFVARSKAIKLEKEVDQCEAEFNNEILGDMKKWLLSIRKSREEANLEE